jgi:hypothetical protein
LISLSQSDQCTSLCGSSLLCRGECGHFESQAYVELTSVLH